MGNANSGDKTKLEKSIMKINLDLCDAVFHRFLLDETIPLSERAKVAAPLINKKMPSINELHGDIKFSEMGKIVMSDQVKPMEVPVG